MNSDEQKTESSLDTISALLHRKAESLARDEAWDLIKNITNLTRQHGDRLEGRLIWDSGPKPGNRFEHSDEGNPTRVLADALRKYQSHYFEIRTREIEHQLARDLVDSIATEDGITIQGKGMFSELRDETNADNSNQQPNNR